MLGKNKMFLLVASSQFRELNNEERQEIKDALGWSDKKIDDKCSINEEGVIKYKTDCQDMEGKTAECGVPYEKNVFDYNGIKIEGVFQFLKQVAITHICQTKICSHLVQHSLRNAIKT